MPPPAQMALVRLRVWRHRHPRLSVAAAAAASVAIVAYASLGPTLGVLPAGDSVAVGSSPTSGGGRTSGGTTTTTRTRTYEPSAESLSRHPVPEWFRDAKLGIFVHWGLYSVPAWASTGMDFGDMQRKGAGDERERWRRWFANNAYAEWYRNTIRIEGSPAQVHHRDTYGENFTYDDFVPMFDDAVERWDPDVMASAFESAGARYVVLTSKHHDGFLMWPSRTSHPRKRKGGGDVYHSKRDIVGELGSAVRRRNMRMAYYYSGGVDWSFNPKLVEGGRDLRIACDQGREYADYADAHWRELIERYDTDVMWNDICYPRDADVNGLFAYYYNRRPDGLVNSRFSQYDERGELVTENHRDFETPEYKTYDRARTEKWESCRGIGHSFGYNRNEGPGEYLSVPELVRSFVDIVSKNGNLLLNVGPMADGSIPEIQADRLRGLGGWLALNGEAIYGTRPWRRAEGETDRDGVDVRFTRKGGSLFVLLMASPPPGRMTIKDLSLGGGAVVELLGRGRLEWEQTKAGVSLQVPEDLPKERPAHAIKITPLPK